MPDQQPPPEGSIKASGIKFQVNVPYHALSSKEPSLRRAEKHAVVKKQEAVLICGKTFQPTGWARESSLIDKSAQNQSVRIVTACR